MTGVSLSAPIDAGLWACESLFGSAAPTKALTKSINDDNVFIFFKVRSIEVQVLSWKSISSICAVQQYAGYKGESALAMLLREATACRSYISGTGSRCAGRKQSDESFFLSCFKGETIFSNSSNVPHSRLLLVWQQHDFFFYLWTCSVHK